MTDWNPTFNSEPQDSDAANDGANQIRTLKSAIYERMANETNFANNTPPFLITGVAGVCYQGNQTDIDALATPANGALVFNTNENVFQIADGGSFANVVIYHDQLGNLTSGDPHTQYLKLDKTDQTISANIAVAAGKTIAGSNVANLATHEAGNAANEHADGLGIVLGAWSSSYTIQNLYTATTDGFVIASCKALELNFQSPSGVNRAIMTAAANTYVMSVSGFVKKGNSWIVTTVGVNGSYTPVVMWIPIGS